MASSASPVAAKKINGRKPGRRIIDISGQRFGRWRVLALHPERQRSKVRWACRCDCGTERIVLGNSLRRGASHSCGCLKREFSRERLIKRNTKHGLRNTRAYRICAGMLQRCLNPNNQAYRYYGGREPPELPITVCERWQGERGFENFFADMGHPPPGMTLERRDNSRGYSPDNCKWATYAEQNTNRRPPKRKRRAKLADIEAYAASLERARRAAP